LFIDLGLAQIVCHPVIVIGVTHGVMYDVDDETSEIITQTHGQEEERTCYNPQVLGELTV
jgi:hypothetical protein